MITAFQIGAFQFTGFQEGGALGSGDLPGWMRLAMLARKRRKPDPVTVDEDEEETVETAARSPLRLRVRAPARVDLGPLLAMAKARDEAEFKALVEQIMASEEFIDA